METALVLPFFILGMLAIIYLINVTYLNRIIGMELDNSCRVIAAYSAVSDTKTVQSGKVSALGISSGMITQAYAQSRVNAAVRENKVLSDLLVGSVDFSGSSVLNEDGIIDLVGRYELKIPGLPFQGLKLKYIQRARMHGWTGYVDSDGTEDDEDVYVYITESGTVYHRDPDCTYLKPHVRAVSESAVKNLRSSDGSKYYQCEICKASGHSGMCYITEYGNRYHTDRNCSGIKRTVQRISIREVGNRRPCSKCGGNHGD